MPYNPDRGKKGPAFQLKAFVPQTDQERADQAVFLARTGQNYDDGAFGLTEDELELVANDPNKLRQKMFDFGCQEEWLYELEGVELAVRCARWMADEYFPKIYIKSNPQLLTSWLRTDDGYVPEQVTERGWD